MQDAWDRADVVALAGLATEPLLDELRDQLAQREPGLQPHRGREPEGRLLAWRNCAGLRRQREFSGLIRERSDRGAPFRELWLLANVKAAGGGWKLARVQSLSPDR